ncbi:MAG: sigma-70 family RNA polymerase sigma factor [Myxococcales bacterium]|nr:sigma-70 family RNA polymerase sigma factor [Myxococcales bacterium]
MTTSLGEHFFRHEFGRLVATLSRRVGLRHLEAVEDAVQEALLAAVDSWPKTVVPDNPSAWLYRVAHNRFVGELRRQARRGALDELHAAAEPEADESAPELRLAGDVRDDLLRMLFVCCDEAIPIESQLALALKTLCGFDVREIAARLFTTEANVYKRLGRARSCLREPPLREADVTTDRLTTRLPVVQGVLYLLFTEGYLSVHAETAIRRELCDEARRLTTLLAEHPVSATPETFALLALMHLHTARMAARQDVAGGLVLLEDQDRSRWDQTLIHEGLHWLARSAAGATFSRFHAEAGIAAEHCVAPSFAETRWDRVIECYALLERVAPSPLHLLNRAVATAELHGPAQGLALLEGIDPPTWLSGSYMWSAVLADLHRRAGNDAVAESYRRTALETAPSASIREVLTRRLARAGARSR